MWGKLENTLMSIIFISFPVLILFIFIISGVVKEKKEKQKKEKQKFMESLEYFSINLCLRTGDSYFDTATLSMLYVRRLKDYFGADNKDADGNTIDEYRNDDAFEILFDGQFENDKLITLLLIDPNECVEWYDDCAVISENTTKKKIKQHLEQLKKNHPKFYMQRYELAEKLLNCKDEHESKRLIARYKNDNVVDFYDELENPKNSDFNFSDYEIKRVTEHKYKFINIEGENIVDDIYVEYESNIQFANQLNKLECFRGTHYFQVPEKGIDLCHYKNEIEKIQEGVYEVWYNEISTFQSQLYDDKYNILIGYYVRCDVDFDVNEWLEKQKEENKESVGNKK